MNWLKANWKSLLLVISLSLNLLVFAGMATHMLRDGPGGRARIQAAAWSQLLPRDFFLHLPEARRKQLLEPLQSYRKVFRDGSKSLRQSAQLVADALDAEPFDEQKLAQAISQFRNQGQGLIDQGSNAAVQVLQALTPQERKDLAAAIRRRAL